MEDPRFHLYNRNPGLCCPQEALLHSGSSDSACTPNPSPPASIQELLSRDSLQGGGRGCPSLCRQASPQAWKWKEQPGVSGRPDNNWPVRGRRVGGGEAPRLPEVTATWRCGPIVCGGVQGARTPVFQPVWPGLRRQIPSRAAGERAGPGGPCLFAHPAPFREKEAGTSHCRCYIDPCHKFKTQGTILGTKSYEAPLPLAAEVISPTELPPSPALHPSSRRLKIHG